MIGVLNTAVARCKIIFPAILPDTLSTMQAINEEKCTALLGAPIILRDLLMHPDRKKIRFKFIGFRWNWCKSSAY